MTNVLVVHHDPDMSDQESEWLRRAGFTVEQCAGPQHGACPILHNKPCFAVDRADVLVYDVWAAGDSQSEQDLIELMRETHPGTPIVLTAPGLEFDWVESTGVHGVIPLVGSPSSDLLTGAVNQALASVDKRDTVGA